jgi:hypothetical protein
MSDDQFRKYYALLAGISALLFMVQLLAGSTLADAVRNAGGFLALTGLALFAYGLWTRRYRSDEGGHG